MYICKNCGQRYTTRISFCNQCGSSMIEPVPTPSPDYSYSGTDIYVTPTPSGGKAQSIVSMIFGIEGICGSIVALIYSFITMGIAQTYSSSYYSPYIYDYSTASQVSGFAGITIFCAIVHLSLGIVALILGCVARNKGSLSSMAGAGKTLGIISTILSSIAFLISIIALSI